MVGRRGGDPLLGFDYAYKRTHHKQGTRLLHAPVEREIYAYDSAYRLLDLNLDGDGSAIELMDKIFKIVEMVLNMIGAKKEVEYENGGKRKIGSKRSFTFNLESCGRCCGDGSDLACKYVTDYNFKFAMGAFKVSLQWFGPLPVIPVPGRCKLELSGEGSVEIKTDRCRCDVRGKGCAKLGLSLGIGPYAEGLVVKGGLEGRVKGECSLCLNASGGCRQHLAIYAQLKCCVSADLSLWGEVGVWSWKQTYKWTFWKTSDWCPSFLTSRKWRIV